ncbi:LamG-like jellyroll fold domain-containing protein [Halosimplex salinum]|uniref:LamG-like jellyroll fold domain-containing protein n=1 Tax=Halosimplex salinum TaxID=1710538 RepID=UPI0013DE260A|nr:LamG-like jellyroll fold domain-containing protein [Halosimplex salinum]
MDDVREATDDLLADKPEVEPALEELLAVDEDGSWTYDDLSIDSGTFGEVVSRGIVEDSGDGYRVTEPNAVRAALNGDIVDSEAETGSRFDLPSLTLPKFDRRTSFIVGGALAFVALVRIVFMWSSVFRSGDIVLAGNDPYYYRYWVDTLLASDLQAFDVGSLTRLPEKVANSDTLLIVVLWWSASLFGKGQAASGLVVAWYPVLAAVVSAGLVYLLSVLVTNDKRVGLAAVLILAVTPAHAFRSALGYGDHHAFDFVWLALTVLAITVLAVDGSEREWHNWVKPLGVLGVSVGVVAQTTAWRGGPILLLPIAGYLTVKIVDDVRADRSPLVVNRRLLSGLAVGGLLTLFVYGIFGWMETYRGIAPALLALGSVGVVGLGEAWSRFNRPARELALVEGILLIAGISGIWIGVPGLRPALERFREFVTSQSTIAETQSLFAGDLGSIAAPILVFGFFLFLALPYLAVATWRAYRESRPEWLVCVIFGWCLFVLSIIQVRFAGEFSVIVSLFSGIGLLHFAEKVELVRPRVPSSGSFEELRVPTTRTIALLGVLFLLFASFGLIQTPIKMGQVAIDDGTYHTAKSIDTHAEQKEIDYPENYVLSDWGRNRVYNYLVNGEADSYGFARDYYADFLMSSDLETWYYNLSSKPVGYVVVDSAVNADAGSIQSQLSAWDRETCTGSGLGHYQVSHVGNNKKVFRFVPGARIIGATNPERSVQLNFSAEISGETLRCSHQIEANPYGVYAATVPYPGTYTVNGSEVQISSTDIESGRHLGGHNQTGLLHWPFNTNQSETAYDRISGYEGQISGAKTSSTAIEGSALRFDGSGGASVNVPTPDEFTISMWVQPDRLDTTEGDNFHHLVRAESGDLVNLEGGGGVSFRVPGVESSFFVGGDVPANEWSHIAVTYNGSHRSIYVDGQNVRSQQIENGTADWGGKLHVADGGNTSNSYSGLLDEFRIYNRALDPDGIQRLASEQQ